MSTHSTDRLKTNYDLLESQQQAFSKGGVVLKNIYSISAKHPILSLTFLLLFGLLINTLFKLIALFVARPGVQSDFTLSTLLIWIAILLLGMYGIYLRIRGLHKDLLVDTPVNQKKVLVTLVSPRTDYKQTPSYAVYESILYSHDKYAAVNSLQEVVLITTENSETTATANNLKKHIEKSPRNAQIISISLKDQTLLDIQKQMELVINKLLRSFHPHEIVVDYTGGTKDMSIALLKASEGELILPIYLNDATNTNHSKYN